jgi:hypothetical protein
MLIRVGLKPPGPRLDGTMPEAWDPARVYPELLAVWGRDTLFPAGVVDYNIKMKTIKDLRKLWAAYPAFSQANTVLVDDSEDKAVCWAYSKLDLSQAQTQCLQPYNYMPVASWEHTAADAGADNHLLHLIGALEEITHWQDVSAGICSGCLRGLLNGSGPFDFLERGSEVSQSLGVLTHYVPPQPSSLHPNSDPRSRSPQVESLEPRPASKRRSPPAASSPPEPTPARAQRQRSDSGWWRKREGPAGSPTDPNTQTGKAPSQTPANTSEANRWPKADSPQGQHPRWRLAEAPTGSKR